MEIFMNKCIIVGAGECSIKKLQERLVVREGDLCIAADGGVEHLLQAGKTSHIVLGDMDSLKQQEIPATLPIQRLPVEKDDTDMLAAIKKGLTLGFRSFEFYGALGGRIDHTIANLQCLLYLMNRGARGVIIGNDTRILLMRNEKTMFPSNAYEKGQIISVFAFGQDAYGVSETGLKYTLDNVILQQEFPVGISNEFMGMDAAIEVKNGTLLLCIEDQRKDF